MEDLVRILVADQLELVAKGLHELFANSCLEVVAHARNGKHVIQWLDENTADVVLIDISLPEMDGIDTTRIIHRKDPKQLLIAHSSLNSIEYINSMLIEGCSGYILKDSALEEFETAISEAKAGRKYLSPEAAKVVEEGYSYTKKRMDGQYVGLTAREREVIRRVALEQTNQEIADALFLSIETIRTYRKSLMTKLDVKTAGGLIKYAIDRRWV
ncbi:MAG: DNA-binding NarL/FixJ family response regulator [Arenicella sp.]|jgi:DNA-binding NarL/FixJ family response regulator